MNKVSSCPFTLGDSSTRVLWEITSKCNLKCKHCLYYSNNKEFGKDLSTEEIFKIIDNISIDKSVNAIWISGGEPLLRNDLMSIIQKISESNIKPSLSTNGTLIDYDYALKLHSSGVDYVHLSIDGVTAEVHDKLRNVSGAFDKVMNAVDFLNDAGITVGATYIVTEESINSVEEMITIAKAKKIKVISFYLVAPIGRGKTINNDKEKQLMNTLANIIEKSQMVNTSDLKIEIYRTVADKSNEYLDSCKGYNFLTITSSGELGACPWFMKSNNNVKRISLKNTPFNEAKVVVQNSMKKYLSNRVDQLRNCKNCRHDSYCGKGCPAVSDDNYVDPLCKYVK